MTKDNVIPFPVQPGMQQLLNEDATERFALPVPEDVGHILLQHSLMLDTLNTDLAVLQTEVLDHIGVDEHTEHLIADLANNMQRDAKLLRGLLLVVATEHRA